jgi:pyruvate dehydrogenase E1 component
MPAGRPGSAGAGIDDQHHHGDGRPDPGDATLDDERITVLRSVERRALWLSTAIIDYANRVCPNTTGLKVGGHQAASASMASIMTVL